ncbi:MAG TPA: hypothetical protein VHZ76_03380, partial [Gammaproteobacteria bacterium]|nr:hypothetical protein [Gammaproteobacteria bacterium]
RCIAEQYNHAIAEANAALQEYIRKRRTQPEYKKSLSFFGKTIARFGYSKDDKLYVAALLCESPHIMTKQHKAIAINGELGKVYNLFEKAEKIKELFRGDYYTQKWIEEVNDARLNMRRHA